MMFFAAMAAIALAACEDRPQTVFPTHDAGIGDGSLGFRAVCQSGSQCQSGLCVAFGTAERCTQACSPSDPCPALSGWTCEDQACRCTPGEKTDACDADGDCDGLADRQPSSEVCNGRDDDCDGTTDNVLPAAEGAKKYYRDQDGDGFGDVKTNTWACKQPAGYVEDGSDCDDTRKGDNPQAIEICGDNYDNDCDYKIDDADVCGLTPIEVVDAADAKYSSARLFDCSVDSALDGSVDITEVIGKQDATQIRFAVRLRGQPATTTCTAYKIAFGDPAQTDDRLVFIYRLAQAVCGGKPQLSVYLDGKEVSTAAKLGFSAAVNGGHISLLIPKAELFAVVPSPSYRLRACTNLTADPATDLSKCVSDTCSSPVHR
ncbi:MAG: hypothetical protein H6707_04750 [Deltaproteobacteria bacterium]|nr:hypothetical protein [Deltaproteobacteria bacterium]